MIKYLGTVLARSRGRPVRVTYLTKAEGEPQWRDGWLIAIDTLGASFETAYDGDTVVESLPWGSIGAIRVVVEDVTADD